MASSRSARESRYADTSRRHEEHKVSGVRPNMNIPKGLPFWNPEKPDAYEIDVVPFEVSETALKFHKAIVFADPGQLYYEQTYHQHYRCVGPDEESACCLLKMLGETCPICEAMAEMRQDPRQKEAAYEMRAKERQLFLVWDHDEEKKGVQLWDISYHNFGINLDEKLKKAHASKKEAWSQFFRDDDRGLTLRITGRAKRIGKGDPFNEFFVDDFLERKDPLPDKIVKHGYCLNDFPIVQSYDDLKAAFEGGGPRRDRNGDDRDRGRGRDRDDEPRGRGREPEPEPARGRGRGDDRDEPRVRGRDPEPEPTRGRGRDADEPPARGRGRDPEPEPAPADAGDDFQIGDKVKFTYRRKDYEGEIDGFNRDKTVAYVKVDGEAEAYNQDIASLELIVDEPPPRGGRDADEPRGRGRDAEEPPARGRGRTADDDAPRGRDADEPPARRGRGSKEPEPAKDEDPPARRGGGRGRG